MAADVTQTFALELEEHTSGPAGEAASALEQLEERILGGQRRLREMTAAMERLKGGTGAQTGAFKQLREQITAQRSSLSAMQGRFIELGGVFGRTQTKQESWLDIAKKTPGPLGALAGKLSAVRELTQSAGGRLAIAASAGLAFASALAAGVVAAVALAAAVAAVTVALVRYGIAAADARRTEELRLAGMIATARRGSLLSRASSSELSAAIERVAGVAAIGRSEVARYGESLARAGLRGANLSAALEGVAISAAVGGDAAGRRFAALAVGASRTGRSVTALSDDVRRRLGGLNASLNVSLGRLRERFGESLTALFGGPRVRAAIDRFLRMLGEIGGMFSQASASGRALRQIVEAVFPSLLADVSDAGPLVRRFFLRAVIAAQEMTIAWLRVRNAVRRVWAEFGGGIPVLEGLRIGLSTSLLGLTARVASGAQLWWHDVGASAARGIIGGLVEGITAGMPSVGTAIEVLGGDAARRFASVLGIRSPSRVFAGFGRNVSRGLADGVRAGAPEATAAVTELVAVPTSPAPRAVPTSAGGGSPVYLTIERMELKTQATDAEGIAVDFRAALVRVLEELGLELGAAPT